MKKKTSTMTTALLSKGFKATLTAFAFTLSFHLVHAQTIAPDMDNEVAAFSVTNSTHSAGSIIAIAGESKPVGYLFCDGREVSKTDYPDLFAAIGDTYGSSGNNFKLPDFRGRFLRGFNGATSTRDADRKNAGMGIGSYQADEFKSHTHSMQEAGNHRHAINGLAKEGGSNSGKTGSGVNDAVPHNTNSGYAGNHKHTINASGGTETRPKNIAVAYYIKATNDEAFEGYVGIGTTSPTEKMDVRGNIYTDGNIYSEGNVGIGTNSPSEKLEVVGTIKADGVKLNVCSFPDYVFAEDYSLLPLLELETYIQKNGHLPGMPAEAEVLEKGMDLAQVNVLLVEKVEELTLHTLAQEKKLSAQEREMEQLKKEMEQIKALLGSK